MNPHLIETTMQGYEIRTYTTGLDVEWEDLTDGEKKIVYESEVYSYRYDIKEHRRIINMATEDFERLYKIPDMPAEALSIIREWLGDEEEEDELD